MNPSEGSLPPPSVSSPLAPLYRHRKKNLRFFATNSDEYKEVCYYLENVFSSRVEGHKGENLKIEDLKQTYLIITDNLKKVRDFDIIKHILESKNNYGFSLLNAYDKNYASSQI